MAKFRGWLLLIIVETAVISWDQIYNTQIYFIYYTALLNAVECSIHLNGASQRSVVNYFSIFDRCYA